jgi:excisionase family DNA binding protein
MAEDLARWLTPAQVADLLQLGLTTVYSELKSGRIRAAHVAGGRSIRITPDALRDYEALCSADRA